MKAASLCSQRSPGGGCGGNRDNVRAAAARLSQWGIQELIQGLVSIAKLSSTKHERSPRNQRRVRAIAAGHGGCPRPTSSSSSSSRRRRRQSWSLGRRRGELQLQNAAESQGSAPLHSLSSRGGPRRDAERCPLAKPSTQTHASRARPGQHSSAKVPARDLAFLPLD